MKDTETCGLEWFGVEQPMELCGFSEAAAPNVKELGFEAGKRSLSVLMRPEVFVKIAGWAGHRA